MQKSRGITILLAILLLITGLSARPLQGEDGIFFEEAGFWVRGEFYALYQTAPDPGRLFGQPVSEAMPDPQRPGILVQYFERARMDYDPTLPAGERVSLAPLGKNLLDESRKAEALDFSTNTNMCRGFSSGHSVCFAFLQFYDSHQGAKFLGEPITSTEMVDGRLVQYFELARIEWHPDRPAGQRVVVTELGRLDYDIRIGPTTAGKGIAAARPLSITADAFISRPAMAAGQEQQVFVVVYDQSGKPLSDVDVLITATFADGHQANYRPNSLTGENGLVSVKFTVKDVQPNEVVRVTAVAQVPGGPATTADTWFRIWW